MIQPMESVVVFTKLFVYHLIGFQLDFIFFLILCCYSITDCNSVAAVTKKFPICGMIKVIR